MDSVELKSRTKRFALDIISLVESLPKSMTTMNLGKQLLRSATSVGANYRAACRARSRADFISKITIVEEADESLFWLELLQESGIVNGEPLSRLMNEAKELTAIFTTSGQTAKHRR
jgi:four helix bundle protein